jgi:hypothetical protein
VGILIINISSSYGLQSTILPVTYNNGEWYGLFGHNAQNKQIDKGWTDFKELAWFSVPSADKMLNALKKQTNDFINFTSKELENNGMALTLGNDRVYFVYLSLPYNKTLQKFQDELTTRVYQPKPFKGINGYAWVPIEKIINKNEVMISLPTNAEGGILLIVKNLIVDDDIREVLQNNWENIIEPALTKKVEIKMVSHVPEHPNGCEKLKNGPA